VLDFRHRDGANQLGDEPGGIPGVPYSDYTGYTPANAKLFFALTNAVFDGGCSAWDNKRAFGSVRPITAIRHLDGKRRCEVRATSRIDVGPGAFADDDEPPPGTDWLPVYAAVIDARVPSETAGSRQRAACRRHSKARKDHRWNPSTPAGVDKGFRTALG
jgi:hypothetical protein